MSEHSTEPTSARPDESPACDTCGHTGAVEFGDRLLCPDCYQASGSCCAGVAREEPEA